VGASERDLNPPTSRVYIEVDVTSGI
jgi:hypothetical protein